MPKEDKIKVLQIVIGGKTFSGVASYLYQYYKYIDHSKVHYDFLFCRENSMELKMNDSTLKESKFYVLNAKKGNSNDYIGIYSGLKKVLSENEYDAVVVNTSIVAVIYACMLATKSQSDALFVAHAHNTDLILSKGSLRKKYKFAFDIADNWFRRQINNNASYLLACSVDAAKVTFGEDSINKSNLKIVTNAIDSEAFAFDKDIRNEVREEMQVPEFVIVYGNVGSFCKRKNQTFLIKAFAQVNKKIKNSQLWLIGDGSDRDLIEKTITEFSLENEVKLLGQREDVNRLMQGMDCFVFPTLSEGLGIVAVESQAAGLPTVISDGVPDDVMISELAVKYDLSLGVDEWAKQLSEMNLPIERSDSREMIALAGYEIRAEAKKMEDFYISIVN